MAGNKRRRALYCKKHHRRRRHHPYQPRNKTLVRSSQLQQQRDQQNLSGCRAANMDDSECDDITPFTLLDIDITSWLPLPEISLFGPLRWCTNRFTQSLDWVKDTVFPSRVYYRELQETREQLMLLQRQIEQLKAHSIKDDNKSTMVAKCNCHHSLPASSTNVQPMQISNEHISTQSSIPTFNQGVSGNGSSTLPTAMVSLPPPPPPPPPPLPPTKLVFTRKKTTKSPNKGCNQRTMVSLSDIMNVKLKKVSYNNPKPSIDPTKRAVIQLTDIMNVQLKKTFQEKRAVTGDLCVVSKNDLKTPQLINDENANSMMLSRISHEAVQFRQSLRRVSVTRSPGGTPLRGKPLESHGTGLTPLMTNALRRKFKMVRTPSSSPPLSP